MAVKGELYRHKSIKDVIYVVSNVEGPTVFLRNTKNKDERVRINVDALKSFYVKVS